MSENDKVRKVRAFRYIVLSALFFGAGNIALQFVSKWMDVGTFAFDRRMLFAASFWFLGGAAIGFLSWRSSLWK